MITRYDDEIQALEERLEQERAAVGHQAEDLVHATKCAAVSPKGLFAAAVIGFLLGEFTRPRHHHHHHAGNAGSAPRKFGVGGLVSGIGLALIRAQYGSPLAFGRAIWRYAASRAAKSRTNAATPVGADAGAWSSAAPVRARDVA